MNKKTIVKRTQVFKSADISTSTKKSNKTAYLLMLPAFIFLFLFTIVPLISLSLNSLKDFGTTLNPFYKVITDETWWNSVEFSFIYAVATLAASLSLSLVIASALSTMVRKRLRGFWQTLFFIPYVTSIVAISVVFANIFDQYGGVFAKIFDLNLPWLKVEWGSGWLTLFTVWVFGVWQSMAFQILILVTAMLSIDKRLYDAADIDGISKTQQFKKITLPQLGKVINYLILLGLITSLKSFTMALYDNEKDIALKYAPTMLLYIYNFSATSHFDIAGAASVLMIIFVILFQLIITKTLQLIGYTNRAIKKSKVNKEQEKRLKDELVYELTKEIEVGDLNE